MLPKHPKPLAQACALLQSAPSPRVPLAVQVNPVASMSAWQTCPVGQPQAGKTLQVPPARGI
jgi:hypothetical protein